jgi:hypothetical protein
MYTAILQHSCLSALPLYAGRRSSGMRAHEGVHFPLAGMGIRTDGRMFHPFPRHLFATLCSTKIVHCASPDASIVTLYAPSCRVLVAGSPPTVTTALP